LEQKKIYLILITSLIIAILHYTFTPYRSTSYNYQLILGQIAEKDIIAPFDFDIYKSEETLQAEREEAAAKVKSVYRVSEDLKFNAQKNLDFIMQHFIINKQTNADSIQSKLKQSGYTLSVSTINFLLNNRNKSILYNYLTEEYNNIFNIGIYPNRYKDQDIKIARENRIIEYSLSRLYSLEEAKQKMLTKIQDTQMKNAAQEISDIILLENIVIDNKMTKLEKQKAREQVPVTIGKVLKNEKIISKNQKITTIDLLKINSLLKAQKEQNTKKNTELLIASLGVLIITIGLIFLFWQIVIQFFQDSFNSLPRLSIILSSILISVVLTIIVNNILKISSLMIPFAFTVLVIAVIFNPDLGLIYAFLNLIFVSMFLNWSVLSPLLLCLSAIVGIIALKRMKKKQQFYPLMIYLLLGYTLFHITLVLISFKTINIFLNQLLYGLVSIISSVIGITLVIPFIERKLNLATKGVLLELLDFDNPLLKRMSIITPGTYHHALIVGNLSESAAEAVGANYLLARVGSYYHDIGKTENPKLFIENNPDSEAIHDEMLANESAILIRKHIQDGISLAKKHNLPPAVINIIEQHHGNGKIKYFFNKAQETKLKVNESDFHYKGPKPSTKEAAIVMIADIVESTTKSLEEFSEERIKQILDETVMRLIEEGQLDEAPLTIKELNKIKASMLPILMGVYRKRLEYPEK